jgi:hypothetical protein
MKRNISQESAAVKRIRGATEFFSERHQLLESAALFFAAEAEIDRARKFPALMTRLCFDEFYNPAQFTGDEVIQQIERCMDYFFPEGRFPFQIKLHRYMLRATLHQTLGAKFDLLCNAVCRKYGWRGPTKNLFAIASRRSGKTTATASGIAAMLLTVPNIMIVVFSVAKRSATEFVNLVIKYINMYPGGSRRILRNNVSGENLEVCGDSPTDTRRLRSFPAGGNAPNVSNPNSARARSC